jgi:hypothetical protein
MKTASSLWTTFGRQLKEPRRQDDLEGLSAILCKNNETALPEYEDYQPWLESFTGTNLRWETLGSVFAALTTATLSLPERDAFFCTQRGPRSNRKEFAVEMKDCVQACVILSNYQDLINIQMVSLLVKNLILQTVISGDTSEYHIQSSCPIYRLFKISERFGHDVANHCGLLQDSPKSCLSSPNCSSSLNGSVW